MTQLSPKPRAAWPSVVMPSILLLVAAVVSVALACKGASWSLETVKAYGTGALVGIALLCAAACSRMFGRPGLLALHLGFALVLGGWVVNEVAGGEEGYLQLAPGQAGDVAGQDQLTLLDFTIDRWEDTGTVRQYTSKVRNGKGEELEISVNHPLVVRPWWVYQSSYQAMEDPHTGEVAHDPRTGEPRYFTILQCVKDVGLPLAAFGGVLLLLGGAVYGVAFLVRTERCGATLPPAVEKVPCRYVLTCVAGLEFLVGLAVFVHRAWATRHPPMQNMYEFLICTAVLLPVLTLVSTWCDRQNTLCVDSALFLLVLGALIFMDGTVKHLMPALQSPFFVPHVGAYVAGYVLLVRAALGAGRRLVGLGFFFLTVGLVLGAAWGKVCWGNWWQFDPKEMWSLATWLHYAAYLHLRPRLPRWADRAFLVAGAVLVVLTLTWINLSRIFSGMHSYG